MRFFSVRSDRDIIATALEFTKQKEAEYHFLRNNCEHFATSCRYQRAFSRQVCFYQFYFTCFNRHFGKSMSVEVCVKIYLYKQ